MRWIYFNIQIIFNNFTSLSSWSFFPHSFIHSIHSTLCRSSSSVLYMKWQFSILFLPALYPLSLCRAIVRTDMFWERTGVTYTYRFLSVITRYPTFLGKIDFWSQFDRNFHAPHESFSKHANGLKILSHIQKTR
jgi:hypothetical protein